MQTLFPLYFLILPILFFGGFFDHSEFPKLLLTYSLVPIGLLLFLLRSLKPPANIRVTYIDILVLLFTVLVGLSTIYSQNPSLAFWGNYPKMSQSLLFYLALGIFYFLIRATFDTFEKIKELLVFVLVGLGLAAIYGLFLYITGVLETCLPAGRPECLAVRVSGTESHSILFGALMLVGFFVSFSLASLRLRDRSDSRRGPLTELAGLIFLAGIIISGSRGVWIATLAGLTSIFFLNLRLKLRLFAILLSCSLVILLGFRLPSIFDPNPSSSTNIRRLELQDAFNLAKDKAFPLGIGASHLPFYYPQYRSVKHNLTNEWDQYPQQIRNNYLDMLIAFGPFALVVFILLIIAIFRLPQKATPFEAKPFLFAGWVALLIYGLFYFYTTSTWIYFWTLTALLVNMAGPKAIFSIQLKRVVTIPLFAGSLVLFFVGGRILVQTLSSEPTFTNGLHEYNKISYLTTFSGEVDTNILFTRYSFNENDRIVLQKAVEYFNHALKTVPYPNNLYNRQYIHSLALLGRMQATPEDQKKYYIQVYEQITKDAKSNPYDPLNFRLRSSISFRMALDNIEREKYLAETTKDDEKLINLDPTNPLNFDNFGLVLREGGKLNEASQAFEKSIELKPDRLPPYLHLAETLEWMDNKKEALEVYQKAFEVSGNKQNTLILEKIEELDNN